MALVVVIVLNFTPDAHIGIYAWLIFAAFPGLHAALPGRLEINTENHFHTNKILTGLEERVRQFGYVPLKSSSKELRYRGKWPEWLTWEKNGVTISKVENGIVILGPIFTLKFIKKRFDDKMQGLS